METLMADPLIEEFQPPGTHPHSWISPLGSAPYPPPSLSLISPMWGPYWRCTGARTPMHVGRAWGGVPWAPHGLGSLG